MSARSTSSSVVVTPNEKRTPAGGVGRPQAHGREHVAGLDGAARAGRPGRGGDAGLVEQDHRGLGLHVREAKVEDAGHPPVTVAGFDRARNRGQEAVAQPIAQHGHPIDRSPALGHRGGQGGGHAHGPGHVRGPAAPTPLLTAAVDAGPDPGARPDDERTAALRTPELVGADRHQPGSGGAGHHIEPRHRLDGVRVEDGPG